LSFTGSQKIIIHSYFNQTMPIDATIVRTIILEQFGVLPTELEQIEMGVMTFKYKVKVNQCWYILRIYPPANTTRTNLEFAIMHQLFTMNCKVPEPVLYNHTKGPHWLLYKFIDGQPLSLLRPAPDAATISIIAGQILDTMQHFTKAPVEGFGFLLTGEQPFTSWKDFLVDSVNRGRLYLSSIKEFDQCTIDRLVAFATQQIEHLHLEKPCLVWSDFSQGNIIIHNNQLAGFVDFEGCVSGDPVMALGYLFAIEAHSAFFESMWLQFKKQYAITYERIVFYTIIRLFRLSKYYHVAFPTGINRDPLMVYFKGISKAVAYVKSL